MVPKENPNRQVIFAAPGCSSLHRRRRWILIVSGAVLLLCAALIYLKAERWTFYSPYSVETSWQYILPSGFSFSISSRIAIVIIIALVVFGIGLLLASFLLIKGKSPFATDRRKL